MNSKDREHRIGIVGGTFDPVHLGHMGLAEAAAQELNLDRVIFMPTYVQPFKQDKTVTEAEHRVKMLELAAAESSAPMEISTWEVDREKVSYTYDTLRGYMEDLGKNAPDKLWFILGSDSMMSIDTWYRSDELLRMCSFAVSSRPTNDLDSVKRKAEELRQKYGADIYLIQKLMLPISSTQVREVMAEGKPISGLVTPAVEEYIYGQGLYSE